MEDLPEEYIPSLIRIIEVLGASNIPKHLFPLFSTFLDSFDPSVHEHLDLKILYDFSKQVGCSLTWLSKLNDITYLVVDPLTLTLPESGHLVDSFLSQLSLFSP